MDQDLSLLPQAAAQMRGALSNLYFAAARLAPAAAREADPELDARAALLDQSSYRLLGTGTLWTLWRSCSAGLPLWPR